MSAVRWSAALLFAVTAVAAAPVPKDFAPPKGEYFPTAVGTRWEYVVEGTDKLDHTREVTESETANAYSAPSSGEFAPCNISAALEN